MTDIHAEWRTLGDASDLIAQIHGDLAADQSRLRASVAGLLGTWHGSAADAYRAGWEDWTADADDVLASLQTMSELIGRVRASFHLTDDGVAAASSSLHSRLGGEV